MNEFNLEQRRKELRLTLEEVGNFVGVSKSTVKKWETGYIDNMKRDKIALLARILEISPLLLLGIDPETVQKKPTRSEIDLLYNDLDLEDKAEIRGTIKQMLKAPKYSNVQLVSDDIINTIKQSDSINLRSRFQCKKTE